MGNLKWTHFASPLALHYIEVPLSCTHKMHLKWCTNLLIICTLQHVRINIKWYKYHHKLWQVLSIELIILFFPSSKVHNAFSQCQHVVPFDGSHYGILNMGIFLIGHDVLRDYLNNFLRGRLVCHCMSI